MLYPHGSKRWSCRVAFGNTLLMPDREDTSSAVWTCITASNQAIVGWRVFFRPWLEACDLFGLVLAF